MIVCCGEALIDFLPCAASTGAPAYEPRVGGSVMNTAVALGRLGVPSGFFGGLSTDFFGDMIAAALTASRVDLRYCPRVARPTTLAFVKLEDGHARYAFHDEGSAGRLLKEADLPRFAADVTALHSGSIVVIEEPSAKTFETLIEREHQARVISLDPNIRPSLIRDRARHIARLERLIARADIVRMSEEDAHWIAPDRGGEVLARAWLALGAKLVVLTRGDGGASAFTPEFSARQSAVKVAVADTVGAGDTFTAGLLAFLHRAGKLAKPALARLDRETLDSALAFAAKAAAVTVSRPGADPPWADEVEG